MNRNKILSFLLTLTVLLTGSAMYFRADAAGGTQTVANYYEWNFENDALNDTENGVFQANTGNNSLTVKTPADLSVAEKVNGYLTNNTAKAGYSIKKAERTGDTDLGNALYVCDRYLDFGTDICLKPRTPWRIEIAGRIATGNKTNAGDQSSYGVGRAALFANEEANDYVFVTGNDRAFYLYDNNYAFSVQSGNSEGVWSNSCRIGQQRTQKLVISNELHEDGHWYIHYQIAECYDSPTDAWNGKDSYFKASWDNRDWVFSGIGSEQYYLTANVNGKNGYNPYISSLKIWEVTSVFWSGVQLNAGCTAESESAEVRMVATVKGLETWREAGYVMSLSNTDPRLGGEHVTTRSTHTVYSQIRAGSETMQADAGRYFLALEIGEIPQANFDTNIYVRPYVIDQAGNVLYGNLTSIRVSSLFHAK